ncbi:MAG TPA: hypothetical protein VGS22_12555 [Thermoanaerobaculia bacterium]|jgi:Tol biopolymer transport system component|nr:hypothetical protein [Thermoanaerobaculia bacterium]
MKTLTPTLVLRLSATALAALGLATPLWPQVELISRVATISDSAIGDLPGAGFDLKLGVSTDGRYVAYSSASGSLAAGQIDGNDGQGGADVFLWDRTLGASTLVSHATGGAATAAAGTSGDPDLSADGRYVAFLSDASDLVPGISDGNGGNDVYLWDRVTGTTVLVSHVVGSPTTTGNGPVFEAVVSADGAFVAFAGSASDLVAGQTDTNGDSDVFLWERATGNVTLVSHVAGMPAKTGAGPSFAPAISSNGGRVALVSFAADLVAGQVDNNGEADVFHWDRATDTTALVSHVAGSAVTAGNGGTSGRLEIDDDTVAFLSTATNLVAGASDTNGAADAFLWRRASGTTILVSHTSASPTQTGDGGVTELAMSGESAFLFVAFSGLGRNHVAGQTDPDPTTSDVFLFSEQSGGIVLASHPSGSSTQGGANATRPAISLAGRWVAFASPSAALVAGQVDTGAGADVFFFDRLSGDVTLVSHAAGAPSRAGLPQFGDRALAISDDGTAVVYASPAADLVAGLADLNGGTDLFEWDQVTNRLVTRRAADRPSVTGGGASFVLGRPTAALDAQGSHIAFTSTAIGLVAGQTGFAGPSQVYDRDRAAAASGIVSHASGSPLAGGNDISDAGVASADGRYFAFWSAATDLVAAPLPAGTVGLYLEDRLAGSLLRVATSPSSKALFDDPSPHAISADGRFLAFVSGATNLVPGQIDTNAGPDVFLFDRVAGTTKLASHASGAPATAANAPSGYASLDASGRFLAFESLASNVSPGQFDTLGFLDVFVFDAQTGVADLVSRSFDTPNGPAVGLSHAPEISADGRWIAFRSEAFDVVTNQVEGNSGEDVFLFDRTTTTNLLVSRQAGTTATTGNAPCNEARPSGAGRYVAFSCRASNLVTGQSDGNGIPDLFLFDRIAGTTVLASHASGNPLLALGINAESPPSISRDGRFVAYASGAALVAGSPPRTNVFLFDRLPGTNVLVSPSAAGPTPGPSGTCINPQISADGGLVVFASTASDLVADDRNRALDVFAVKNATVPKYFTLSPCRLYDSRSDGAGPLTSGVPRIRLAHGLCGVPTTATAIAVNVSVTAPTALGFLTLYPGDSPAPAVATINFGAGQTRTNNALVQLALDGTGTYAATAVVLGSGTVQIIVDVAGYFE